MTALRLTTDEAADVLGICERRLRGMATRRGWIAEGDTWQARDIHTEVRSRAKAAGDQWTAMDTFTKAGAERVADFQLPISFRIFGPIQSQNS